MFPASHVASPNNLHTPACVLHPSLSLGDPPRRTLTLSRLSSEPACHSVSRPWLYGRAAQTLEVPSCLSDESVLGAREAAEKAGRGQILKPTLAVAAEQ